MTKKEVNKTPQDLNTYLINLITSQTKNFKPQKIKLLLASKENPKINEFNYFKFTYDGITYELLDGKLKTIKK